MKNVNNGYVRGACKSPYNDTRVSGSVIRKIIGYVR